VGGYEQSPPDEPSPLHRHARTDKQTARALGKRGRCARREIEREREREREREALKGALTGVAYSTTNAECQTAFFATGFSLVASLPPSSLAVAALGDLPLADRSNDACRFTA
jgi:hypothetical protein